MFAITGITGKVGGETARRLLEAHLPVRAVVRSEAKGAPWAQRGCEIAVAEIGDADALTRAFSGAEAVFVLVPPIFDPLPEFPEVKAIISALKTALLETRPGKVVVLSTIGAQAVELNLLSQLGMVEQELSALPIPIAFLRAAWFMENASLDVEPARTTGTIQSFLQPLQRPVPMIATEDIGKVAAQLLQETWTGHRVVELEGPRRITPLEMATTFSRLLERPVQAEAPARSTWEELFHAQGMKNPTPRMRMLDGFNEGWIEFEAGEAKSIKGTVELESVLRTLLQQ
ncbi:MAG: NmrA family NAD(P)-binding protein [Acidobacteriaceae bacterium]